MFELFNPAVGKVDRGKRSTGSSMHPQSRDSEAALIRYPQPKSWQSFIEAGRRVRVDDGIIVPQGARHNVISTGKKPLRLYTIYGPPEHIDGAIRKTCEEANAVHEHFDGKATE